MSDQVEEYIKPADAEEYVVSAVQTFLGDPPDSEFQSGFLSALLVVAEEALDAPHYAEASALCTQTYRSLRGIAS